MTGKPMDRETGADIVIMIIGIAICIILVWIMLTCTGHGV
jgi:hypothetical protein